MTSSTPWPARPGTGWTKFFTVRFEGGREGARAGQPARGVPRVDFDVEWADIESRLAEADQDGADPIAARVAGLPKPVRERVTRQLALHWRAVHADKDRADHAWLVYRVLALLLAQQARDVTVASLRRDAVRPTPEQRAVLVAALTPAADVSTPPGVAEESMETPPEERPYEELLAEAAKAAYRRLYKAQVVDRGMREHRNPTKTRPMTELEQVASQAKAEIDAVFGHLRTASPMRADRWWRRGNLHDQLRG